MGLHINNLQMGLYYKPLPHGFIMCLINPFQRLNINPAEGGEEPNPLPRGLYINLLRGGCVMKPPSMGLHINNL